MVLEGQNSKFSWGLTVYEISCSARLSVISALHLIMSAGHTAEKPEEEGDDSEAEWEGFEVASDHEVDEPEELVSPVTGYNGSEGDHNVELPPPPSNEVAKQKVKRNNSNNTTAASAREKREGGGVNFEENDEEIMEYINSQIVSSRNGGDAENVAKKSKGAMSLNLSSKKKTSVVSVKDSAKATAPNVNKSKGMSLSKKPQTSEVKTESSQKWESSLDSWENGGEEGGGGWDDEDTGDGGWGDDDTDTWDGIDTKTDNMDAVPKASVKGSVGMSLTSSKAKTSKAVNSSDSKTNSRVKSVDENNSTAQPEEKTAKKSDKDLFDEFDIKISKSTEPDYFADMVPTFGGRESGNKVATVYIEKGPAVSSKFSMETSVEVRLLFSFLLNKGVGYAPSTSLGVQVSFRPKTATSTP